MIISTPIFEAYIKCPYKCWQFCLGEKGEENVYLDFIRMQNHAYRTAGLEKLIDKFQGSEYVALPSAPVDIKTASWRLAIGIVAKKRNLESHLHAVEQLPSHGQDKPVQFVPIRFNFVNKLTKSDKLLLTFDAFVLSEMIGREITHGKIIHGNGNAAFKV